MEKPDIFHPIPVILNGSNYAHWVEAIRGFLKGRKLWRYVTGDIVCPVKSVVTTTPPMGPQKPWRLLRKTFLRSWKTGIVKIIRLLIGSATLPLLYQLLNELHSLKQERGQAVFDFLTQMKVVLGSIDLL
ncbi:hypothetical protein PIB30_079226 [Stylosanthes scabra]|uniref:Retrotransposon Copia-like N-terminal domain-containing protein n=1 Tax=Stylosanthes scabra TaxID=79078 RepID=A0ABU6QSB5_9FABA|nr:hypothetical protein [Stylosanthes scabra]